ncbi:hypothetical protein GDO81_017224 [Engystomops pustulosus]|uniref:Uncharacterized protein n=1 Tax=Engystomops pustulosus TaxID=76066 RepID=A0AAV7AIU6_ENGPU|nr:hypothetical protein GDO81_017224 [Engystomops pustulosus]
MKNRHNKPNTAPPPHTVPLLKSPRRCPIINLPTVKFSPRFFVFLCYLHLMAYGSAPPLSPAHHGVCEMVRRSAVSHTVLTAKLIV